MCGRGPRSTREPGGDRVRFTRAGGAATASAPSGVRQAPVRTRFGLRLPRARGNTAFDHSCVLALGCRTAVVRMLPTADYMVKYDRHFFLSGSKRRFRSQALTDLPSSRSSALAPGARLRDEASSWRARCGGSTAIEQYERRAAVAAAARRGCTRRRSTDMSVLKASPRWSNALTSAALGRPRAPPTASLWPRAAGAQLSGPGSSPEQAGEPLTRWVAAWAAERAAPPCTSSPKQLPTRDVQKSARHAHESSRCMACSRAASRAIGHSAAGSSPSRPVGTRSEKRPQSSTSSKGSASSWLG